jgi:hypothetical protein
MITTPSEKALEASWRKKCPVLCLAASAQGKLGEELSATTPGEKAIEASWRKKCPVLRLAASTQGKFKGRLSATTPGAKAPGYIYKALMG